MKPIGILALLFLTLTSLSVAELKCEANINGFKIRTVYIMGDQYNGVVWAYKHLSEETCLTPTTDLDKADAILEVHRFWKPGSKADTDPLSVSCMSNRDSTVCSDSTGNQMVVNCNRGACNSYYGPSLYSVASEAFDAWISSRWFESDARIYTTDHKLLWKSETQKGDWAGAGWIDLVRLGTNSPVCKCGAWSRSKYKNFRHWASTTCGVEFGPLVTIDIKLQNREAAAKQKQAAADELVKNAQEAAAKQKEHKD